LSSNDDYSGIGRRSTTHMFQRAPHKRSPRGRDIGTNKTKRE